MNDDRSGRIASSPQAQGDAQIAEGVAASAAAPSAGPKPLTHAERRIIAMGMMVPVFVGSVDPGHVVADHRPRPRRCA
jgi:hypothetical protein